MFHDGCKSAIKKDFLERKSFPLDTESKVLLFMACHMGKICIACICRLWCHMPNRNLGVKKLTLLEKKMRAFFSFLQLIGLFRAFLAENKNFDLMHATMSRAKRRETFLTSSHIYLSKRRNVHSHLQKNLSKLHSFTFSIRSRGLENHQYLTRQPLNNEL